MGTAWNNWNMNAICLILKVRQELRPANANAEWDEHYNLK